MNPQQLSSFDRSVRRAILVESVPVIGLGVIALALGSSPDAGHGRQLLWLGVGTAFALSVVWVLLRNFRRADEYQRKIQLESMAVAFAAVLVALQVAAMLDATGVVGLRQLLEPIVFGGIAIWLLVADLRTRVHR